LLGSPRIERDDLPVEVDTRKAIALIAYLAVTGQSHSRDALAALLWPDADQASARAALRRTLSTLNKALAGEALDIDREAIGVRRDAHLWVDVAEFRGHLAECQRHGHPPSDACPNCLAPLTRAVVLYRDHFLAGFSLRDSPEFDDWQFFQSEGLRRELAGALERLVRCQAARGDFETAIGHARRWLALDPLHEPAHRELIQLYALAGQRAAALRQYRECVRVLEEELGVPPLAETTRLSEAIKENRELPKPVVERSAAQSGPTTTSSVLDHEQEAGPVASTTPVPPAQFPATRPGSYPLIGRSSEWDALARLYGAMSGDGHLVVVEGEAGIGKTRLVEALVDFARARGATTIAARCYEGETNLAYGPIIAGLRDAARHLERSGRFHEVPAHWLSEVARLLPEVSGSRPDLPPTPPLDNPGAQSRFFDGVSWLFWTALGGSPPGVLLIDDLHWADTATLDLLTYLIRRLRDHPVLIVVTWRDEYQASSPHVRQVVAESQRDGLATIFRLTRLNQAAVRELAESVMGGMISGATDQSSEMARVADVSDRLYRETEGLPFFVVEYLAAMARNESPIGAADWSLPGGARDLLRARLSAVSQTAWQLLSTAAVIGRSFDFDTLREASGRSDDETVLALEELVARGLVGESRSGTSAAGALAAAGRSPAYDFGHEKLRAFVYDETSLVRRRLLHRRVAEALVSRARSPRESGGVAGQIAQHYQLAGSDAEAAVYFHLAGEHARALYANAEALAHFNLALALGHADTAGLHEAIGDLQVLRGEYGAAIISFETAAALTPAGTANVEHKLGNVHQRLGEWDLAESHFQAALTILGESDSAGELARLYADWSLAAHQRGQSDRALDMARRALDLASTTSDARALAQVHNILGILVNSQGDVEAARSHLRQSLSLAEALGDPGIRAAALNNLALATGASGEIEPALALAEAALALCVSQGDRHHEAAVHNNLADLLHAAGRSEEAMSHLKKAVTIFADIGQYAGAFQPEIWKLAEW
jgi:DNA-binding SARP family transcriptional activator